MSNNENSLSAEEINARMLEALRAATADAETTSIPTRKSSTSSWNFVPECSDGEFLIEVLNGTALACVVEPTWIEATSAEGAAYRFDSHGLYFSGEAERRKLLSLSIVWIADRASKEVMHRDNANLLNITTTELIDDLWNKLASYLFLSLEEARHLKDCAFRYFSGTAIGTGPVPAIVLEIDAMKKGLFSYSASEFKRISMSDYARMALVFSAYQEAIDERANNSSESEQEHEKLPIPNAMIRAMFNR